MGESAATQRSNNLSVDEVFFTAGVKMTMSQDFFLLSIKPYSVGHHRFHLKIVIVEKHDRQFLAGVLYGSA